VCRPEGRRGLFAVAIKRCLFVPGVISVRRPTPARSEPDNIPGRHDDHAAADQRNMAMLSDERVELLLGHTPRPRSRAAAQTSPFAISRGGAANVLCDATLLAPLFFAAALAIKRTRLPFGCPSGLGTRTDQPVS
jgi:hypothetical protein